MGLFRATTTILLCLLLSVASSDAKAGGAAYAEGDTESLATSRHENYRERTFMLRTQEQRIRHNHDVMTAIHQGMLSSEEKEADDPYWQTDPFWDM